VYTVRGGHGGGRRVHVYRSIATARRPNIGLPEMPGEQACAHWRTLGAARRSSRAENNLVIISVKPGAATKCSNLNLHNRGGKEVTNGMPE
jgi:hypothetical protein